MTDGTTSALLASAARKIRSKRRLSEVEHAAVVAAPLPEADRARILEANASFTVAAARAGGRLSDHDRRIIAQHAPEVAQELRDRDQATKGRHRDAQRRTATRYRSAELEVDIGQPENPRRRKRCSKSLERFLRTYFAAEFAHPFDKNMREVIRLAEATIDTGGRFAVIMPRGSGKTTVMTRAALWGALTGRRPFIVLLSATEPASARLLQMLSVDLAANELLREDWPEVCSPFHAGEGRPQRLRALHAEGEILHCNATRDRLVFPMLDRPGSAAAGQIIVCRGLTGALRGITHTRPDGSTVRPSCVLVDDPQSDESARSPHQIGERESLLSGAVLGLAGPRETVAALVALTCIRRNDLADRLLDPKAHPEFTARRFPLVETWPTSTAWEEYDHLWQTDGPQVATTLYRKHRRDMDDGAVVSCRWRIRPGEVSAIQTAHNLRLEMGATAFASEMQGQPEEPHATQYEITAETIIDHTTDVPRLHLPPAATVFGGHCDINRAGLHWVLVAFDQAMTAHIVDYGRHPQRGELWPENAPQHQKLVAIFAGLKAVADHVAGTEYTREGAPVAPGLFLVDASFESDTVHRFAEAARYTFRVAPAIGRAAHRYRWNKQTLVGRPGENCHVQRPLNRRCPYVMFNADAWREVMQRAFLATPGAPGGCTLYAVPNPRQHVPFAEHVIAEKLVNKYQTELGWRWEWTHPPGAVWDWADALTGSWVAAALQGLTTSGQPTRQNPPTRHRRRVRHIPV
ncbi:terminase gpA endonuclease subunit [Verrucomicrobiota bacterium]